MPTIPPYARHLLTPREIEVLERLPAPPAAIARSMYITPYAVRSHLKHIRHKLGIPSKAMLDELAPLILAAAQPVNLDVTLSCPNCNTPFQITVNRLRRPSRRRKTALPEPD